MSGVQNQQILVGYIVAVPDSETEKGARAALQTDDGTEYFILPKGMGIDIAEHVNARAELSGLIEESGGLKFVMVRNYSIQDGFEDDWYDDND